MSREIYYMEKPPSERRTSFLRCQLCGTDFYSTVAQRARTLEFAPPSSRGYVDVIGRVDPYIQCPGCHVNQLLTDYLPDPIPRPIPVRYPEEVKADDGPCESLAFIVVRNSRIVQVIYETGATEAYEMQSEVGQLYVPCGAPHVEAETDDDDDAGW